MRLPHPEVLYKSNDEGFTTTMKICLPLIAFVKEYDRNIARLTADLYEYLVIETYDYLYVDTM